MKTDSMSNQLRWVVLLLAAAVILPTVCLLWFMNQAVKNERLAVRQELSDFHSEELTQKINQVYQTLDINGISENILKKKNPLWIADFLTSQTETETVFLFDNEGHRIWPILSFEIEPPVETNHLFSEAWKAEFQNESYNQAIQLYEAHAESEQQLILISAQIGMARCHEKLSDKEIYAQDKKQQLQAAIGNCMVAAYRKDIERCDSATLTKIMQSRLYLLHLNEKMNQLDGSYNETFKGYVWDIYHKLYSLLFGDEEWQSFLPADSWLLAGQTVLELYQTHPDILQGKTDWNPTPAIMEKERLARLITLSKNSIQQLNTLVPEELYRKTSKGDFNEITSRKANEHHYSFIPNDSVLSILAKSQIEKYFYPIYKTFSTNAVQCRILDAKGNLLLGPLDVPPMLIESRSLKEPFSDWKVELFFSNSNIFEETAKKQVAIYLWTGVLVVLFILATGTVAIRSVNHQIKMNRLKNDFIATVTHELKTPLASMRLLVDTLLEGNYESEQTATEYLQLVANENIRLTHLIDSFLTFSRMERNKQVFDFRPVPPAEIANAAVEAMGTKFKVAQASPSTSSGQALLESQTSTQPENGCKFSANIAKDLPLVSADKDGMITVLVNLLDNAYKYTNGNKRIELKVYQDNGNICFSVKDNGIGLSPRAQKKIFNRFYQVDSRLSRRAEGCGLGLSIVKFIVDAHKGMIDVESKAGEGSVFIIRLPSMSYRT